LIVIGSAAVDVSAQATALSEGATSSSIRSTLPGTVRFSLGGVGRNIAEAAHRILTSYSRDMSSATLLVSPVGDDPFGRLLVDETRRLGMRTDGLMSHDNRSAVCNMVVDSRGELIGGVADMDIIQSLHGEQVKSKFSVSSEQKPKDWTGSTAHKKAQSIHRCY
jgi:pseudouridine-5'-phosphate glycosidase/pseudouridine kinase